jgi:hypothetical protein
MKPTYKWDWYIESSEPDNWSWTELVPLSPVDKDLLNNQVLDRLTNTKFLTLPSNLDMSNATVQCAVAEWYLALENLKRTHEHLSTLDTLAKDHD